MGRIHWSMIFYIGKFHNPFPPVRIKLYETSPQKPWCGRGLTNQDPAMEVLDIPHKVMTPSPLLRNELGSPEMLLTFWRHRPQTLPNFLDCKNDFIQQLRPNIGRLSKCVQTYMYIYIYIEFTYILRIHIYKYTHTHMYVFDSNPHT